MHGKLLVLRKAYSIVDRKQISTWHEKDIDVESISNPDNFEIRLINCAAKGKSLHEEFKELSFGWSDIDNIEHTIKSIDAFAKWIKAAIYFEHIGLAIFVSNNLGNQSVVECHNIDELKRLLNES